jgi:hypothetical protein
MLKEYIVSLNQGVDYDAFWNEIETDGSGSTYIPDRAVDIVNVRPLSLIACHYALSDEEAEKLRNDPRVYCVEIPPDQRDDIEIVPHASQTGIYSKATGTPVTTWTNWGLPRQSSTTNNTPDVFGSFTYDYDIDGTGVDFVVQDTGLQCDHPDFQDGSGVSRVQKINWWTAAGQSGPPPWNPNGEAGMPAGFYTDTYGHGTHVAGITAGKTYGRAKNSRIYVMKVAGLGGVGGVDISLVFDLITGWHNNKPIDPVTGYKRPTVVNMSWGYRFGFNNINGGNYRGTNWSGGVKQPQYGMVGSNYGVRVGSVDADVQQCITAGVILVGSAGNNYQVYDSPGGLDYNNYYNNISAGTQYYMRGGSPPAAPGVICVGSVDVNYAGNGKEQKAGYSDSGPRIDIFSPGTQIVSTISNVYDPGFATPPYGVNTYPYNPSFKICNVSGTSMAAPNIAGIVAQLLQMNPDDTPADILQRLIDLSTKDVLYDTGSRTDYSNTNTLHGSPNRYGYFPFEQSIGYFIATGAIEMLNVTINT